MNQCRGSSSRLYVKSWRFLPILEMSSSPYISLSAVTHPLSRSALFTLTFDSTRSFAFSNIHLIETAR